LYDRKQRLPLSGLGRLVHGARRRTTGCAALRGRLWPQARRSKTSGRADFGQGLCLRSHPLLLWI